MKLGNVATGASFFNREEELSDIWEKLKEDHLILSGPRRLGKSSILHKLLEQSISHGFQAKIVDLQGIFTAMSFIEELYQAFPAMGHTIGSVIDKLNPFHRVKRAEANVMGQGGALELTDKQEESWQKKGDPCMERLAREQILVLIDEFPVFLEKMLERHQKEAVDFLDWLRRWLTTSNHRYRFIFTGSVGLHSLLERHQLTPQMNHCDVYALGPFKRRHALQMLQHFASKKEWILQQTDAEYLCDKIGWLSPFFLNLLLSETILAARDRYLETSASTDDFNSTTLAKGTIIGNDIDDGYERLLALRSRFSHWKSRLEKQVPPSEMDHVMLVLSEISRSDTGLNRAQLSARLQPHLPDTNKREQLLEKFLYRLVEEGYLTPPDSNGNVQFLSFLLKDYWRRNHG